MNAAGLVLPPTQKRHSCPHFRPQIHKSRASHRPRQILKAGSLRASCVGVHARSSGSHLLPRRSHSSGRLAISLTPPPQPSVRSFAARRDHLLSGSLSAGSVQAAWPTSLVTCSVHRGCGVAGGRPAVNHAKWKKKRTFGSRYALRQCGGGLVICVSQVLGAQHRNWTGFMRAAHRRPNWPDTGHRRARR